MRRRFLRLGAMAAAFGLWLGGAGPAGGAAPGGNYSIDTWGTEQGLLPDGSVIAMLQTRDGYLWLGTLNGLVRFDGVRFTVFDESNTPKLQSIRIVRLFEDSQGNLWVGTETAGVALIEEGRVQSLKIGRGRRRGHLASVCEDFTGAVWLLTEDGQLGRSAHGSVDVWNLNSGAGRSVIAEKGGKVWLGAGNRIVGLDPAAVRSEAALPTTPGPAVERQLDLLLASRSGGFWCLADGFIRKYSGTNVVGAAIPYPWTGKALDMVKAACEDRDGNLVVATGGSSGQGIFWFDERGNFTRICATNRLPNDSVYCLHVDADGDLWAGLDGGGLNRIKRRAFKLLGETYGSVVQSLCPDAQGGVWMSAKSQDFSYWKDGLLRPVPSIPGPMSKFNPTAILVDRQQRVWAAAKPALGAGLFRLENGVFRPVLNMSTPEMSALFEDRSGGLWVGTEGGLGHWDGSRWQMLTTNNGLSANSVHALAQDRSGDLWIGTELGGLDRLRDGHIASFQQNNGFPSDNISALYVDADDVLWAGTFGNGLIRLRDGHWTHYTTENGLIGNSIDYLIEDGDGFLWIGSNAGLMRARRKDLNAFAAGAIDFISCRAYDKRDGLPATECTLGAQPAACRTPAGDLWFPTIAGVVSVNPKDIHSNTNPPPVVIESALVEGQDNTNGPHAAPPPSVVIPAGREHLEIQYTSLNLGAADRARFRYRLEGHETKWNEAGSRRFARYATLPPGSYRFQVRACNEDGVWNETGASLAVLVLPLFWQTAWFRALLAAALLGLVSGAVYYISTQKLQRQVAALRQQQALEKERARIARDIHDQVGASLTQLALLGDMAEADKDNPEEAAAHARQISQTSRETSRALDEIVWTVNPSNDTLDGLVNYICKQAQDYLGTAGVRFRLDVPPQLPPAAISPETRHNVFLAAREAVTNVVKHARASEACLRLRLDPDSFTLEIEDNGRGPAGLNEKAAASRNGLRNMRKRMEDIGGGFLIGPGGQGGTRVRLTVPLARS
jgi:signal transduction histidine kinase/ligand-binding sensor domain-containing protein